MFSRHANDPSKDFVSPFRLLFIALFFLILSCSFSHAAEVTLAWTPSDSAPSGYNIHYGLSSGNYDQVVDAGNPAMEGSEVTYQLTVADGQTYYIAATAYDDAGNESVYSNEVVYTAVTPNSEPVATGLTVSTSEDISVSGVLQASDADGDALAYSIVTNGSMGNVVIADPATGAFVYTPNANASGTDSFTFKASDGQADSNSATVAVAIAPVNDPPAAAGDAASVNEDGSVTINVLANDTDEDGDTLILTSAGPASHGSTVISGGGVIYTPQADYNGIDSFSYQIEDDHGGSSSGSVTVTIQPVNDPPVAMNLAVETHSPATGFLSATDPDSQTLTYSLVSNGSKGTVVLDDASTGQFTYTPQAYASGTDTFTYRAGDGYLQSNVATVTVTILESFKIQVGETSVDNNWTRVAFNKTFDDPVVVATIPGYQDEAPCVVRIRNVDSTGFELKIQQWEYLGNNTRAAEKVGYVVLERGRHMLEDGTLVEAGRLETDKTLSFARVSFEQPMNAVPVVMTAVVSENEADAVVVRMRNVATTGFELKLQEQEANAKSHATESIAYIAWEPSAGMIGNLSFEAGRTENVVTQNWRAIAFQHYFVLSPVVLADMQTVNGGDPAALRYRNKESYQLEVKAEEEQSKDSEINHAAEVVGYLGFCVVDMAGDPDEDGLSNAEETAYGTNPTVSDTDGDGIQDADEVNYWASLGSSQADDIDGDGLTNLLDRDSDGDGWADGVEKIHESNPADPFDKPQLTVEAGEASVDHTWTRIAFSKTFVDPVVTAKPASYDDQKPCVVRIRNVDAKGFEMRVQEWDYLGDGAHLAEKVGYLVMERGSYTLEDGTMVEAGRTETNKTGSFLKVAFNQPMVMTPVIVSSIISFNEADAVTLRLRNATGSGFELTMQEQEANAKSHALETISYIAWEPSSGIIGDVDFEVGGTGNVVTHKWRSIAFQQSFAASPIFLADMLTAGGGDTCALRFQNKQAYGVEVKVEEEQSKDSETNHATEAVGYMVFSSAQ